LDPEFEPEFDPEFEPEFDPYRWSLLPPP